MSRHVLISRENKTKIREAIATINALTTHTELKKSLAPLLDQLIRYAPDHPIADPIVAADEFDLLRQNLLTILNPISTVNTLSQQLWLILNTMAKIKPLNERDIFDLTTSALDANRQPRDRWIYASSGHAFPIQELVKCRISPSNLFFNPCIGAKSAFNHHDQGAIKTSAQRHHITIPDPMRDAEAYLTGLYRRHLSNTMLLALRAQDQLPNILEAIMTEVESRRWYSGCDDFLRSWFTKDMNYGGWILYNAMPILCYIFVPEYSLFKLSSCLLITSITTAYFTNIVRQFFVQCDAAFYGLLKITGFFSGVFNHMLCKEPTLSAPAKTMLQMVTTFFPPICNNIATAIWNMDQALSTNGRYIVKVFTRMNIKVQKILLDVTVEKLKMETARFCEGNPYGRQVRSLFDAGKALVTDMYDSIQHDHTPDIQTYFQQIMPEFLQAAQAQFMQDLPQSAASLFGAPAAARGPTPENTAFGQLLQRVIGGLSL